MRSPRGLRAWSALTMLALCGACGGEAVLTRSEEPFLYLTLQHGSSGVRADPQRALLVTAGTPLESEYRIAERFEMRRGADRRAFAWREAGRTGRVPGDHTGVGLDHGNYVLPDEPGPGQLGARDLRPGETYELFVETQGVRIRGAVTIPAAFGLVFGGADGRTVSWPRVRGAAAYSVEAYGVTAPRMQTDTFFVVPTDRIGSGDTAVVEVQALDPELHRYLSDRRTGRAGIDRGYGVFGALSRATGTLRSASTQTAQ